MSHALCIMAGFLASRSFETADGFAGFVSFLGAGACLIAAAVIRIKFGE